MVDSKENYKFDLGVKGLNFLGSMSVSKQLRTYPSPDPTTVHDKKVGSMFGWGRGRCAVARIIL